MSYDDNEHRPAHGAYTPPTDDDLPINRRTYDARGGSRQPPLALLISLGVLLLIAIVILVMAFSGGFRKNDEAPPLVGEPVGQMKVEAPVDAQPIDPAADVGLYGDGDQAEGPPQFAPPPEAVQPRPTAPAATVPAPAASAEPAPPKKAPAAVTPTPVAPAAQGGSSAVQIGAFSTTERADRAYAEVSAAFPQFVSGRSKRVTEFTNASGVTLYRTAVAGFSAADARTFCEALRASGRSCSVQ